MTGLCRDCIYWAKIEQPEQDEGLCILISVTERPGDKTSADPAWLKLHASRSCHISCNGACLTATSQQPRLVTRPDFGCTGFAWRPGAFERRHREVAAARKK